MDDWFILHGVLLLCWWHLFLRLNRGGAAFTALHTGSALQIAGCNPSAAERLLCRERELGLRLGNRHRGNHCIRQVPVA